MMNDLHCGMSRREWLATSAAATGIALTSARFAAADDAPKSSWIDAHSHIWTRDVEKFPLANGSTVDDLAPPSFTAEELLEVANKSGVARVRADSASSIPRLEQRLSRRCGAALPRYVSRRRHGR